MLKKATLALVALSAASAIHFQAQAESDVQLAMSAQAKMTCAIYAWKSDRTSDNARWQGLRLSGLEDLNGFLSAFEQGRFSESELYTYVPMSITLELGDIAISRDFAAGQIVANFESSAVDEYSKEDNYLSENYGKLLDFDLWSMRASALYDEKNCNVLSIEHSIKLKKMQPLRPE